MLSESTELRDRLASNTAFFRGEIANRITSYNVCYTKLLRGPARRAGAGRPTWSGIAALAGYADQSHLIREFKALAGLTPARWAAERRGVGFVQSDGGTGG